MSEVINLPSYNRQAVSNGNLTNLRAYNRQKAIDIFYMKNGPCCAGCDRWQHVNSTAGDCTKSAPVPAGERWALIGLKFNTWTGAGHVVTPRHHKCGDFKDSFDWNSLPVNYLQSIGRVSQ
jgi:hypothetical protein